MRDLASRAVDDVDGDGLDEVLAGAREGTWRTRRPGRARLLSGRDGRVLAEWSARAQGLGAAVAGLGDLDSDGRGDLAFGAPNHGAGRGRVALVVGAVPGEPTWIPGPAGVGFFGAALAGGRDATGDGLGDLVVGAPRGSGSVFLIDGATGEIAWQHTVDSALAHLGIDVAFTPDLDDDGRADVLAGAPGERAALLVSGANGALIDRICPPPSASSQCFADSVAAIPVGGGGALLLAGASSGGEGALDRRAFVHVFHGTSRTLAASVRVTHDKDFNPEEGRALRVRALDDLDGDGVGEIGTCLPNGMKAHGPMGWYRTRSGASGAPLHDVVANWEVGFNFPAWHFGADACSMRRADGPPLVVVACAVNGGVVAFDPSRQRRLLRGWGPVVAWLASDPD